MSILLQNKIDRMERALAESRIGLEVAADAPIEDFVAKTKFNNVLNIYCQEEEPESKEGVWLKTERTYDLVLSEPYITATSWELTELEPTPSLWQGGSGAKVGDYLYYFGGWGISGSTTISFKYHIPTQTCTRLPDSPTAIQWGIANVVIDTDIYIGGEPSNTNFYKFDTITETYTKLANSPNKLYGSAAVVTSDQKYIYAFGGIYDYNYHPYYNMKYDIENNKWTYTQNNPQRFGGGAAFAYGDYIYFPCPRLFSNWTTVGVAPKTYRYNVLTGTWTSLNPCPQDVVCVSGQVVGEDIYFMCDTKTNGASDGNKQMYRYNIPSDTYTRLDNLPYSCPSRFFGYLGLNTFVATGRENSINRMLQFKVPVPEHKIYNKDTVIVWENISNLTYYSPAIQLCHFGPGVDGFKNINKFYVKDVTYQTAEGEDIDTYSVYYGDGEKWNLLKEGDN